MKRLFAAAAITAALTMFGGYAALAAPPDNAPAHGEDCGFGEIHSTKAMNGHIGNGGHVPGHHQGANYC